MGEWWRYMKSTETIQFTWSILSFCWFSPCSAINCCLSACSSRPNCKMRMRSWSSSLLVDCFRVAEEPFVVSTSIVAFASLNPSCSIPSSRSVVFVAWPLLFVLWSMTRLLLSSSNRECPFADWETVSWWVKPLVVFALEGLSSISIRLTMGFDEGAVAWWLTESDDVHGICGAVVSKRMATNQSLTRTLPDTVPWANSVVVFALDRRDEALFDAGLAPLVCCGVPERVVDVRPDVYGLFEREREAGFVLVIGDEDRPLVVA